MFDNQTSMDLTACIFGLSTLLSSYQIYNVQNRIQVRPVESMGCLTTTTTCVCMEVREHGRRTATCTCVSHSAFFI